MNTKYSETDKPRYDKLRNRLSDFWTEQKTDIDGMVDFFDREWIPAPLEVELIEDIFNGNIQLLCLFLQKAHNLNAIKEATFAFILRHEEVRLAIEKLTESKSA